MSRHRREGQWRWIWRVQGTVITDLPVSFEAGADGRADILCDGASTLSERAAHARPWQLFPSESAGGRVCVVLRHGCQPERKVLTAIGPVPETVLRVRDRGRRAEEMPQTRRPHPPARDHPGWDEAATEAVSFRPLPDPCHRFSASLHPAGDFAPRRALASPSGALGGMRGLDGSAGTRGVAA